jgi:hypothetical protein
MMLAFRTCHAGFWRTMPDLVMDSRQHGIGSEQIDTDQEDHCSDEVMYAAVSRPWLRNVEKPKEAPDRWMRRFEADNDAEVSWKTV